MFPAGLGRYGLSYLLFYSFLCSICSCPSWKRTDRCHVRTPPAPEALLSFRSWRWLRSTGEVYMKMQWLTAIQCSFSTSHSWNAFNLIQICSRCLRGVYTISTSRTFSRFDCAKKGTKNRFSLNFLIIKVLQFCNSLLLHYTVTLDILEWNMWEGLPKAVLSSLLNIWALEKYNEELFWFLLFSWRFCGMCNEALNTMFILS